MEEGMKKKLKPEEELEMELEILNNSMIKSEIKFIICIYKTIKRYFSF